MELDEILTPWVQQLETAFQPYPVFIKQVGEKLEELDRFVSELSGVEEALSKTKLNLAQAEQALAENAAHALAAKQALAESEAKTNEILQALPSGEARAAELKQLLTQKEVELARAIHLLELSEAKVNRALTEISELQANLRANESKAASTLQEIQALHETLQQTEHERARLEQSLIDQAELQKNSPPRSETQSNETAQIADLKAKLKLAEQKTSDASFEVEEAKRELHRAKREADEATQLAEDATARLDELAKRKEMDVPQAPRNENTGLLPMLTRATSAGLPERSVLLIDDAEVNRVLMSHYFKSLPVKFEFAKSVDLASEKCKAHSFDLILVDEEFHLEANERLSGETSPLVAIQNLLGGREERIEKLKSFLWTPVS